MIVLLLKYGLITFYMVLLKWSCPGESFVNYDTTNSKEIPKSGIVMSAFAIPFRFKVKINT